MSVENLKKYTEHCNTCDDAKARSKNIGHDDLDGHIAHAKEYGFEFSAEHVGKLRDELLASGDLTDEQLEQAAGGTPTLMAMVGIAAGAMVAGAGLGAGSVMAAGQSHW